MSQQIFAPRVARSLFSLRRYLIFFLFIAFVVSACFLLFLRTMHFESTNLARSALLTLGNVILLSFACSVFDGIRHKKTVEEPVRRILQATHQLTQGDFSARIQPLHESGEMNELDLIIHDFNKMAEELSGLETLRTDFVANVSHELKTPLAVMQNYAVMLQAPNLPDAQRMEYARAVADGSRRLSELITNILRLNKLENQNIYPDAKSYNLGEQLRECILAQESMWERKNIQMEIDIDDVIVEADGELLSLVWNNLLSNAIKFTDEGGTITVKAKEEAEWMMVSVTDTGCGMNAETGRHIFEKFYQGDGSHGTQGNGLGLALVKRAIEITGGEISVQSALGVGSTFVVRLPKTRD